MGKPEQEPQPSVSFTIKAIETPAQQLSKIITRAHYEGPEEFMIRALEIFQCALEPGAGGKVVVENGGIGKRYVFNIVNKQ